MIRQLGACVLAAVMTSAIATSAVAAAPRTSVVDLGGTRAFVRTDAAGPLAGVQLLVRAGLDRQTPAQSGLAALVAECVLHTPVDGTALVEAVDARGASISYAVGTQFIRFYLEGTPDGIASAAPLVARALATPSFDRSTLAAARSALGERISDEEGDPRFVGAQMLRASYYRNGAGLPVLGNSGSLAGLSGEDAQGFHDRWYLRGDAVVAEVGRTGDATDLAARTLAGALAAGTAPRTALAIRAYGNQPKRIVTQRDVFAPYVALGFAAPALGDRDFPATLVIRSVLNDLFGHKTATTQAPAFRAIGALYGYDASPAQMIVWLNGSRVDPSVGVAAVDAVVKSAGKKPLTPAVLSRYKDMARGEWALETVTLDERAFAIGNAVSHGLDADTVDQVGAAIARVTGADVQRVAKKYFQKFDLALIVPRSAGG